MVPFNLLTVPLVARSITPVNLSDSQTGVFPPARVSATRAVLTRENDAALAAPAGPPGSSATSRRG